MTVAPERQLPFPPDSELNYCLFVFPAGRADWQLDIYDALCRHDIENANFAYLVLCDDPPDPAAPSLGPSAFGGMAKWSCWAARTIIVGGLPKQTDRFDAELRARVRRGCAVLFILTRGGRYREWFDFALQWGRRTAEIIECPPADLEVNR